MNYIDFRTTGFRNLHVCKELLSRLETCAPQNKSHLLHKIYYLSGYIIEVCYKFALFSHLHCDKLEDIYKFGDESFRKKWKEHNFDKLDQLCREKKVIFSQDIPFLGSKINDREIGSLIKAYDVQIRYSMGLCKEKIDLKEGLLRKYIDLVETILCKVNSKFS